MNKPVFLPDDIVKHWPEVFKGIKVKAIPLEYLDAFHVTFSDGKKWIVECQSLYAKKEKTEGRSGYILGQ